MTTDRTYHFMAVVKYRPNYLLVVIAGRKANLGSGWAAVRGAMPKLLPFRP